jgi:hypothetical protein
MYDDHFAGVDVVLAMAGAWHSLQGRIDGQRFAAVSRQFERHILQSRIWRDVLVSYYFDDARIISTATPWVQLEIDVTPTLLLGGSANDIPIRLTNATGQPQALRVSIDPSQARWTATVAEKQLEPRESVTPSLSVTPPIEPYLGPVVFSCDPAGLTVLGFDTQIMLVTPAAGNCSYAFDVGSTPNNVVPGYRALTAADIWDGSTGYGWVGTAPQDIQFPGFQDLLQRDFATDSAPRTVRLQIPAGKQRAWVLIGGQGSGTQPVRVALGNQTLVETAYLEEGMYQWFGFGLDGGSRGETIDLTVSGTDGRYWRLAAFVVLNPGL